MSQPDQKQERLWRLDGKVALVTGAAGYLGSAFDAYKANYLVVTVFADNQVAPWSGSLLAAAMYLSDSAGFLTRAVFYLMTDSFKSELAKRV